MRHLQDLPVLVLGLGASGLAMARWCAAHGAQVTVADTREAPPQLEALRRDVPAATFVAGEFTAALVEGTPIRAVYRSPGLSPQMAAPVLQAATAVGLIVGGELDLFAQALKDLREPVQPEAAQASDAAEASLPTDASTTMKLPPPLGEGGDGGPAATDTDAAPELTPSAPTPTLPQEGREQDDDLPSADGVEQAVEPGSADEQPPAPLSDDDEPPPVVIAPPVDQGYRPAVLAITGTNGKTTVTSLVGQLVERAGKTVAVAGNIGPTLLDTLAAHIAADTLPQVWVLELSSFQLDGVRGFEPTAATVLNVTQDHLDWHGSMEAYAAAKARIFGASTSMLLNRDDPLVMGMLTPPAPPVPVKGSKASRAKPVLRDYLSFGADMPQRPGDYGLEVVNGMAWLVRAMESDGAKRKRSEAAEDLHFQRLMPADALRIRGRHNAVNALAALALANAAGCAFAPMLYGLREYRGEPHRVESIAIVRDVEYFDDSKGTNVGATVAALYGLGSERRVVVILGGDGKGQDFSPLAPAVARHARAVVLIGRDAPLIRAALADTGISLQDAGSMQQAVQVASERAHPGDAVLMSPACASFDMFRNYEHRAEVFREVVGALGADAGIGTGSL